jgi:protein transport protein SEC61 subunit gamma-like protein
MADQVQEILDVPREFLKDGIQFINRAQKRMPLPFPAFQCEE